MVTLPKPVRTRTTEGSKRLAEYAERNGIRPVAWYVPIVLHTALAELAVRNNLTLQFMITHACETRYANHLAPNVPPLVSPTRLKTEPHKNVTWYAPVDLHKSIKLIALGLECTAQQLITSAVVDQYKGVKELKVLNIATGSAPYARAPVYGDLSLQRPPRPPR